MPMSIHALLYTAIGLVFVFLAGWSQSWLVALALGWVSVSFLLVGVAYGINNPHIFRKRSDGSLPLWTRWLFIPFLLAAQLYNAVKRSGDGQPRIQAIAENLYVASRVTGRDLEFLKAHKIQAILDVTAEFDALNRSGLQPEIDYLNIPVLDHSTPTQGELHKAVHWLDHHLSHGRPVVVHCALGRGRSVLVALAYLLSQDRNQKIDQAIADVQKIRKKARLNRKQLKFLRKVQNSPALIIKRNLWLVANAKSGGGKWQNLGESAVQYLSQYFDVTVREIAEDYGPKQIISEARAANAEVIAACGGDGTVTSVAEQLIDSDIPLAVLPLGTTNAVAKTIFGLLDANLEGACSAIVEGQVQAIDTACVNNKPMLLMAAIGFEQQMISHSEQVDKDNLGQLAYLQGLWNAVNDNQILSVELTIDEQPSFTVHTASLAVANLAPMTSVLAQGGGAPNYSDGQLDITWLNAGASAGDNLQNLFELALTGVGANNNSIEEETSAVNHRKAKSIKIRCDDIKHYVIDGELYDDLPLEISVRPKSLKLLTLASTFAESVSVAGHQ